MGEVLQFEDVNSDLEHPLWFYKACGDLSDMLCMNHADMINGHDISGDEVFEAAMEVPPRLMALMQGDDDIEKFVGLSVLNMSFMLRVAKSPPAKVK